LHGAVIEFTIKIRRIRMFLLETQRIGDPILGIIIPLLALAVSIILPLMLYKKFSKKD